MDDGARARVSDDTIGEIPEGIHKGVSEGKFWAISVEIPGVIRERVLQNHEYKEKSKKRILGGVFEGNYFWNPDEDFF